MGARYDRPPATTHRWLNEIPLSLSSSAPGVHRGDHWSTDAEMLDDAVVGEGGADHPLALRSHQLLVFRVIQQGFEVRMGVDP